MKKIIIYLCLISFIMLLTPISAASNDVVYLTFDDGPNQIGTDKILDILDKYDIKATFFVVGEFASYYPDKVRAIYNAGHTIGCHTCTHDYNIIYSSQEALLDEIYNWEEIVYSIIGTELPVKLFRFPGGSKNKKMDSDMRNDIISALNSDGYKVFDWNITNNDAHIMKNMTQENVEDYVKQALIQSLGRTEDNPSAPKIILMHDVKKHTANTLEWTIQYLLDCGYSFDTLDKLEHSYIY